MATEIDESKLQKLKDIREKGVDPYPYTFNQTHHAKEVNTKFAKLSAGEQTEEKVAVAGRIMLKRVMGKAAFFHIQDQSGKVQVYLQQNALGAETYKLLAKKLDLGDIIGVEGLIFKTKLGEVTVNAHKAEILCKTLLPMPEKFHGLKDEEIRYRQRYIDLTVNPEIKEVFIKRTKIIQEVRDFFIEKGFLEVETPVLHTIYGGANARPFKTHINAWDMPMYLSISPELFLKKLVVGGFEKVFTICKNFRNEGVDASHNPEFTMLEAYQSFVDYNTIMELMEQVYERACIAANGSTKVKQNFKGKDVEVDFKAPWERMSMLDAIKKHADLDVGGASVEEVKKLVDGYNITYEGDLSWGLGVQLLFEELVEDKLIQPIHITDHPAETTPLCKKKRGDDRLIERFESFCMGMELCNAYSELNDPLKQRELLEQQAEALRGGEEEAHPMDEDFMNCIEFGMTPAGGLGFGIDRMVVILTGVESIRDIILFPTMKPTEVVEHKNISWNYKTKRLYFHDHYRKEFPAKVLFADNDRVILDQTCFFVQGGGQAGDSGEINGAKVKNTEKINGNIVHILETPGGFEAGEEVVGKLAWERRHKIMRMHSASHIVGYFFEQEFKDAKILDTMAGDHCDETSYKLANTKGNINEVQKNANEFIAKKNPIEMVEEKPGYMVWTSKDIKEPCGGTHVKNTSEIGPLEITATLSGNIMKVVTKFK